MANAAIPFFLLSPNVTVWITVSLSYVLFLLPLGDNN